MKAITNKNPKEKWLLNQIHKMILSTRYPVVPDDLKKDYDDVMTALDLRAVELEG